MREESEIRAEIERQEMELRKPRRPNDIVFHGVGICEDDTIIGNRDMVRALRWALGEREKI